MFNLTQIFIIVDSWVKENEIKFQKKQRNRAGFLSLSELITIKIASQSSRVSDLKSFINYLKLTDKKAFSLPSYARLMIWLQRIDEQIKLFLESLRSDFDKINAVDSTALPLLKFGRKGKSYRFADVGHKTKVLWFQGMKLHLITSEIGEIISFLVSPGNVADIRPLQQGLASGGSGILTADSGYIDKILKLEMSKTGLTLLSKPRKNQKQLSKEEAKIYKKRIVVERTFSSLKTWFGLKISGLRNKNHVFATIYAACAAYQLNKKGLLAMA